MAQVNIENEMPDAINSLLIHEDKQDTEDCSSYPYQLQSKGSRMEHLHKFWILECVQHQLMEASSKSNRSY